MPEGEDHKLMKKQVAQEYENKGYNTELEYQLPNGKVVDVYAISDDEKIGIEVGSLTSEEREEKILECCNDFVHISQWGKNFGNYNTTDEIREDLGAKERKIYDNGRINLPKWLRNDVLKDTNIAKIDSVYSLGIIYDPDESIDSIIWSLETLLKSLRLRQEEEG